MNTASARDSSVTNSANKPNSLCRYERKFLPGTISVERLISIIRLHPAHFYELYPARFINNIYFDAPGFKHYHDNISGAPERSKVRIRWYGEQYAKDLEAALEIKTREGLIGRKQVFPLCTFELNKGISARQIIRFLKTCSLTKEELSLLMPLEPVLLNRYHRSYWQSPDQKYRLTIDSNLSFSAFKGTLRNTKAEIIERYNPILELKYDHQHDSEAERISREFPFRLDKNSKYVKGIQMLYYDCPE